MTNHPRSPRLASVPIYFNDLVPPLTIWPFMDGYQVRSADDLREIVGALINLQCSRISGNSVVPVKVTTGVGVSEETDTV